MLRYCESCEKITNQEKDEFEEQYECGNYYGERLVDYWVCQECYCALDRA